MPTAKYYTTTTYQAVRIFNQSKLKGRIIKHLYVYHKHQWKANYLSSQSLHQTIINIF